MHCSLRVMGSSHVHSGLPCQDAAGSLEGLGGVGLVVADGAGSAPLADIGSALALKMSLANLRDLVDTPAPSLVDLPSRMAEVFTVTVERFRAEVEGRCQRDGTSPDDFASTLAFTIWTGNFVCFAGVGDAFLVARGETGKLWLLVPPVKPGGYRNETEFITHQSVPRVVTIEAPEIDGLVLSTDGLEKFIDERVIEGADGIPRAHYWGPSRTFAGILSELEAGRTPDEVALTLGTEEFQRRKGDDMGISVAWR